MVTENALGTDHSQPRNDQRLATAVQPVEHQAAERPNSEGPSEAQGPVERVPGGAPTPAPLALSVQHLSKVFLPSPPWMRVLLKSAIKSPIQALDDVTFELERGATCVVIGPNGAGKSTLFRILTGLTTASSGGAWILGTNVDEGRQVRSMIGYMPADERSLMLRHTCAQNLMFRGQLQSIPRKELRPRIDEVLEQVGIAEARDRAATALSTGMRARLQLAAAILHRPKLLILDEPTSTVDPVGAYELLLLIERLKAEEGMSVVLSSHRLEEIDAMQDKVVFLDKGRAIHAGPLRELRQLWERPAFRLEFRSDFDVTPLARQLDADPSVEVDVVGSVVEVTTDRPAGAVLASLGPAIDAVVSMERVAMPLRVLFHKLVTSAAEEH